MSVLGVLDEIGQIVSPRHYGAYRARQKNLSEEERQSLLSEIKAGIDRTLLDDKLTPEQRTSILSEGHDKMRTLLRAKDGKGVGKAIDELEHPPSGGPLEAQRTPGIDPTTGADTKGTLELKMPKPGESLDAWLARTGVGKSAQKWTPLGTDAYDAGNGQLAVVMKNDAGELKGVPLPAGYKLSDSKPDPGKPMAVVGPDGKPAFANVVIGQDGKPAFQIVPGATPIEKKAAGETKPGSREWSLEQYAKRKGKAVEELTKAEEREALTAYTNETQPYAGPRFKESQEKTRTEEFNKSTSILDKYDNAIGKPEALISALQGSGPVDVGIILQYFDAIKATGVRFTQAEQNLIQGARNWAEGLEARGQHIVQGTELGEEQRKTMVGIIKATQDRIKKQRDTYLHGLKIANPELYNTIQEAGAISEGGGESQPPAKYEVGQQVPGRGKVTAKKFENGSWHYQFSQ